MKVDVLLQFVALLLFAAGVRAASVDPTQYGLKVDASTGNAAALNAAITAAHAGDTVNVPAGMYPLDGTINLKSDLHLVGAGASKTILKSVSRQLDPMLRLHLLRNVELTGFSLDGNHNPAASQGIVADHCSGLNIRLIAVSNLPKTADGSGPHGILFSKAVTDSDISDNTFSDIGVNSEWGAGIRLAWGSSGNRVLDNTINRTGRGGILCNDDSTDNIIAGNTIAGSGGVGLGIEVWKCDRSLIEKNKVDHWLSVDSSNGSAVRDNMISDDQTTKLCGIELVDVCDVTVVGNVVRGGAKVGLSISGKEPKERLLFVDNRFERSTTWATQIQGEAGGVRDLYFLRDHFADTCVGPNALYPNQGHGIRINDHAHSIVFAENEIVHNAGVGIQIVGGDVDDLSFFKNHLAGNRGGTSEADPVAHVAWEGNDVTDGPTSLSLKKVQAAEHVIQLHLSGAQPVNGSSQWSGIVGRPVRLDVSPQGNYLPSKALWDMGDGLPQTGLRVEHTFKNAGSFPMIVVTWDDGGHAAIATATVNIAPPNTGR